MMHLINSEMYYHAKSIETLSGIAHALNNVDEKKEAEVISKFCV